MFLKIPRSSLLQHEWTAGLTLATSKTCLSEPYPSSQSQRSDTVCSDHFGNIVRPLPLSSDDRIPWSRTRFCRSKYLLDCSSLMAQGPGSLYLLFTDDCFLDGLADGFGIMVVGIGLLVIVTAFIRLVTMWLRSSR